MLFTIRLTHIYYGWWIALSYFVMNTYWSGTVLNGFSILFNPIKETFGLSVTLTTVAFTLRQALTIIGSPFVGYWFDRVGPRPLIAFSTAVAAGGLLLLAAAQSAWSFFLAFFVSGIGIAIFVSGTGPAAMATWFIRYRGRAIALIMSGAAAGSLLLPLVAWLEDGWGWRRAVLIIVAALLVLSVPCILVLRRRPEDHGLRPDGDPAAPHLPATPSAPAADFTLAQTLRTQAFWLSALSAALMSFGGSAVSLFVVPHLEDQGFSSSTAALVITGTGVMGLAGTLMLGWLSDYLDRRLLIACGYLLQGGGISALIFASAGWPLALFVVLFGIGVRVHFPLLASLQAEYFGRASFGRIQGVMISLFMTGGILGPIAGGPIRDATDSYQPAFALYASMTLLGVAAISLVRRPNAAPCAAPTAAAASR